MYTSWITIVTPHGDRLLRCQKRNLQSRGTHGNVDGMVPNVSLPPPWIPPKMDQNCRWDVSKLTQSRPSTCPGNLPYSFVGHWILIVADTEVSWHQGPRNPWTTMRAWAHRVGWMLVVALSGYAAAHFTLTSLLLFMAWSDSWSWLDSCWNIWVSKFMKFIKYISSKICGWFLAANLEVASNSSTGAVLDTPNVVNLQIVVGFDWKSSGCVPKNGLHSMPRTHPFPKRSFLILRYWSFFIFFHDLDPPTPVVGGFRFINSGATVWLQRFFSPLNL